MKQNSGVVNAIIFYLVGSHPYTRFVREFTKIYFMKNLPLMTKGGFVIK
jgi:hypothetical protein